LLFAELELLSSLQTQRIEHLPMFGTVARLEILEVVNHRDALGLDSTKEVVLDRISAAKA
jgi:hypothetical protein